MHLATPVIILLGGLAIGLVSAGALNAFLRLKPLRQVVLLAAARKPLVALLFAAVLLRAAGLALPEIPRTYLSETYEKVAQQALALVWLVLYLVAAVRFAETLFRSKAELASDPSETQRALVAKKLFVGAAVVLGLIFGLRTIGIDTSPLLAGGAVGGVIIGLALQESLSNIFSGLLFTLDGAVRIGDLVRFGSGKEGYVQAVGWRSTRIRLHDETLLVVPNAVMSKEVIENLSRPSEGLIVSLEVNVQVGEDLARVETIALDVLRSVQARYSHGQTLREPWVRWRQISETGVLLRLFLPVGSADDQYVARSDLLRVLHEQFKSEKVSLPLPVRVVHPTPPTS